MSGVGIGFQQIYHMTAIIQQVHQNQLLGGKGQLGRLEADVI